MACPPEDHQSKQVNRYELLDLKPVDGML
jgi:hypothetical protein